MPDSCRWTCLIQARDVKHVFHHLAFNICSRNFTKAKGPVYLARPPKTLKPADESNTQSLTSLLLLRCNENTQDSNNNSLTFWHWMHWKRDVYPWKCVAGCQGVARLFWTVTMQLLNDFIVTSIITELYFKYIPLYLHTFSTLMWSDIQYTMVQFLTLKQFSLKNCPFRINCKEKTSNASNLTWNLEVEISSIIKVIFFYMYM